MGDNSSFETIMREISQGLTGNPEEDMKYLCDQGDKYKDHEFGKEILRACGRMMADLIPEDKKRELEQVLEKDSKGIEAALEEVRFCIYKKDYDKALKLMEGIVKEQEETNMYADDSVSEYHCFREPMEDLIYQVNENPEKDLRNSPVDYAEVYMIYGSLLVELKRLDDAEIYLRKAIRWNPSSAQIAFEYAEIFKMRGMIEEFADLTRKTFKISFRSENIARCYRNLAYYYVEKQEYEAAVCCLLYSTKFGKSELVQSELYYISQKTGKIFDPDPDELKAIFEKNEIPFGADENIVQTAYYFGLKSYEQGNTDMARYFLEIFDAIGPDDETVKTILKKIND